MTLRKNTEDLSHRKLLLRLYVSTWLNLKNKCQEKRTQVAELHLQYETIYIKLENIQGISNNSSFFKYMHK